MDTNQIWTIVCIVAIAAFFIGVWVSSSISSTSPDKGKTSPALAEIKAEFVDCTLIFNKRELVDALALVNVTNQTNDAIVLPDFRLTSGAATLEMVCTEGSQWPAKLQGGEIKLLRFRKKGAHHDKYTMTTEQQAVGGYFQRIDKPARYECEKYANAKVADIVV